LLNGAVRGRISIACSAAPISTVRALARGCFVAFIDIDELLFWNAEGGLPRALDLYVSAVAVNQRIFGSSGLRRYRNDHVTTRFVRGSEPDNPENRWVKTVALAECVESFSSVHSATLKPDPKPCAVSVEMTILFSAGSAGAALTVFMTPCLRRRISGGIDVMSRVASWRTKVNSATSQIAPFSLTSCTLERCREDRKNRLQ
jgi:hypothetical protein